MQAAWTILFFLCYMIEHHQILWRGIRVEGTFEDYLVKHPAQSKVICDGR